MIYLCNHCGQAIFKLRTPGDEINKDFICPACSDSLQDLLKKAKQIQTGLLAHFKLTP